MASVALALIASLVLIGIRSKSNSPTVLAGNEGSFRNQIYIGNIEIWINFFLKSFESRFAVYKSVLMNIGGENDVQICCEVMHIVFHD